MNCDRPDDAVERVDIEDSKVICSTLLGDQVLQTRIFDFSGDNQPVTHALFSTFSSSAKSPQAISSSSRSPDLSPHQASSDIPKKALVVVLKTLMHIIYLEGGSYIIHLPFPVVKVWAIPLGLLLERQLDPIQISMLSDMEPQLPRLFTLSSPLEDFGTVNCNQSFLDPIEKIIFISSQRDGLCVTRNTIENRITLWYASPDQQARRKVMSP